MAQQTFGPVTFTAGEALVAYRRVKPSGATSKTVVYADAGDPGIGLNRETAASGEAVTVNLWNGEGTRKMEAAGAIAIHRKVYPAADGKITATPAGKPLGISLAAASGSGSVIEVLPISEAGTIDFADIGTGAHGFFEDFEANSLDADRFVATASDSGALAFADGVGGVVQLGPSDSSAGDNDEIYLHQTLETFKFAAGKPFKFAARVKLTEANTDDANVFVGLMDAVAADSLQNNGAGPKSSYSGAGFFKVDGGTVWQAEASIGSTQDTDTDVGAVTSAAWVLFEIEFDPGSGVTAGTVRFYLDGTLVHTASSFDYTSATEMEVVAAVKNGDTNEELLDVDYLGCVQAR